MPHQRLQGQFVAQGAQAADHAQAGRRGQALVAEVLAAVDVREVDLDTRQAGGGDGVADRDARVRVGRRIDDQSVGGAERGADGAHQLALDIALEASDSDAQRGRARDQARLDVGQRLCAVDARLAFAEQGQVRPVEHADRHASHSSSFASPSDACDWSSS